MVDERHQKGEDGIVLDVKDLHTEFRLRSSTVHAVDGVSFSVHAGECIGLVGESGCGKSTTGLSIMKLLPDVGHVTGGTIRLLGRDLGPMSEREMQDVRGNDVAMIFQDPMTSLNPTQKIGRQIAESVRLHRRVSRDDAMDRALEVLTLVGMPRPSERLGAYPHQLSGGLRQRVMIAMALSCDPKLLIADEPTTALDVTIQAQILDLIDELRERLRMACILITHDLGVIAARTDKVMVMYAGKIVEQAPTAELFARMRHPYAEALLRSIPRLDQDRSVPLYSIAGLPPDLAEPPPACRFAPRCRYATSECTSVEPPLDPGEGGRPDHVFACYHPVEASGRAVQVALVREPSEAAEQKGAELGRPPVIVELDHLVKEYPVHSGALFGRRIGSVKAISDVSLSIHRGETFGLVGESGCGKTTIGRQIVALERPSSGTVVFEGTPLSKLSGKRLRKERRDLQMMFQDPYASLDPRMRVGPIIREPLAVQQVGTRAEQYERVRELLGEVGLPERALEMYPHEFSGGQRQRIGLARALALNPKLIVADEPVSALDVSIQSQILNLMRSLQERHGLTYVVISHDLAVVKYLADTIGVMYLGKLVELGPAERIYTHTVHPYTQGLIDAIPEPDPVEAFEKRRMASVRGELPSPIDPPSGCRFRTRCPFAEELCATVEPPLRRFGDGHLAACHFPLREPEPEDQSALNSMSAPSS